MAGTPKAFQADAFQTDAFQTGDSGGSSGGTARKRLLTMRIGFMWLLSIFLWR